MPEVFAPFDERGRVARQMVRKVLFAAEVLPIELFKEVADEILGALVIQVL